MLPSEPVFDITEDNNALSILSNLTNEERATKAFPEGNQQDMEPIQDLLPVNRSEFLRLSQSLKLIPRKYKHAHS